MTQGDNEIIVDANTVRSHNAHVPSEVTVTNDLSGCSGENGEAITTSTKPMAMFYQLNSGQYHLNYFVDAAIDVPLNSDRPWAGVTEVVSRYTNVNCGRSTADHIELDDRTSEGKILYTTKTAIQPSQYQKIGN